ncbi:type II toxin-antitoxin system mRNA interferase toxin, RelE/StbE family [Candidatus Uhrbacteria bacterium CG_4_9_14_3_um_filter_50_9]|uniref:Type II toxin-antitoxin system mRNA interferase toxin, RelE/StbE family n=1 Tax=Candidatus Uhrbacteria bacterium CG_4_9_14_3_um_filter_50_9 TaxID=1975035 RepID=A0A2M7XBR6_9BACT|nr:MAG: type II toxin-antitoxin system mRNA interferase toxin, RelE/StbE family [Candidatus Uhrbacteria bacterium CG_4_9_14_3_um_filter_50_9]
MYRIVPTKRCKRQLKKLRRSDEVLFKKLLSVVDRLAAKKELDVSHRDHQLKGSLNMFRECHVEPDWLLIYRIDNDILILQLIATGSHSNLFD